MFSRSWDYLPTSNKLQIYRSRVWSQLMAVSTNRNLATEKNKESIPWAPAFQFVPPWPAKMAGGQCWRVIRLLWHLQRQEKNVVHSTSKLTSIKSLLLRLMLTWSINLPSNRNSQSATKSDRNPECHTEQVYYLCNFFKEKKGAAHTQIVKLYTTTTELKLIPAETLQPMPKRRLKGS
jgi:hypothetical protein